MPETEVVQHHNFIGLLIIIQRWHKRMEQYSFHHQC